MKSRKSVAFNERFNKSWLGYAAAAGATGVGMLATAQLAPADIIYTPANISLQTFGPTFLDVNNDGIVDFRFFGTITGGTGPRGFYSTRLLRASAYGLNGFKGPLNRGAVIGAADSFAKSGGMATSQRLHLFSGAGTLTYRQGPWADVLGYLGLEFQIDGQTHFGWAELDVNFESGDGSILGYAYDTVAEQSLEAGQTSSTPEPGTLGLLALGSLGLGFWRRRKAVGSQQ
jgi:PEP-CTERM motif